MSNSAIDISDLKSRAAQIGVTLDAQQLDQFSHFSALLAEWNERLNLTAVPPAEYVERHFLDCLSVTTSPAWKADAALADIGTGAGFPGLPLKIAYPELKLLLVESLHKRCNFLSAAVSALKLTGVEIVNERGEIFAHSPARREKFDLVCARAVANMASLAEILLPYVHVGGAMIVLKGTDIATELSEAEETVRISGGDTASAQLITLPASTRSLTVITSVKISPTPARLPRSFAAISKKPLAQSR